jgi:hypothetical protein
MTTKHQAMCELEEASELGLNNFASIIAHAMDARALATIVIQRKSELQQQFSD